MNQEKELLEKLKKQYVQELFGINLKNWDGVKFDNEDLEQISQRYAKEFAKAKLQEAAERAKIKYMRGGIDQ